jgi:hypothetical protein
VFSPSDLAAGKDPAMAKAIEVLASTNAYTLGSSSRVSRGR